MRIWTHKTSQIMIAGFAALAVAAIGCGKKKDDNGTDEQSQTQKLSNSAALLITYAGESLASVGKKGTSTAPAGFNETASLLDSVEAQSTKYTSCSNKGRPWDSATNAVMDVTNAKYAETQLSCQLQSDESPETVRGMFAQVGQVVCDLEKNLGALEYTAEGKAYSITSLKVSEACGWSADQIQEMSAQDITATITAKSYSSGDWQKSVDINVANGFMTYTVYLKATDDVYAVKIIEGWKQSSRSGNSKHPQLSDSAEGKRGGVIALDPKNAVIRAEIADTYWGRRSRLYAKGTTDTNGQFTSLTDYSAMFSDIDYQTGFGGSIVTVKGTEADGLKYRSYSLSGISTVSGSNNSCTPSTKACTGNDGIEFSGSTEDQKYYLIGAVFSTGQSQANANSAFAAYQTWLTNAGLPSFTSVTKDPTL